MYRPSSHAQLAPARITPVNALARTVSRDVRDATRAVNHEAISISVAGAMNSTNLGATEYSPAPETRTSRAVFTPHGTGPAVPYR